MSDAAIEAVLRRDSRAAHGCWHKHCDERETNVRFWSDAVEKGFWGESLSNIDSGPSANAQS
jgi:hypothetical protein